MYENERKAIFFTGILLNKTIARDDLYFTKYFLTLNFSSILYIFWEKVLVLILFPKDISAKVLFFIPLR